jgi:hypothetical protein
MDVDTERSPSAADDSRFLPEDSPPTSKKRKKPTGTKKKSQVVYSEASDSPDDDLTDVTTDDDTPPKRKAKARPGQLKGAKGKGLKDRDERKPPATASRGSSAAPLDLFSNDDLPLADAALGLTIPKKRKLPPIKKTKLATGTPNPTAATQKPAPAPVQEPAKPLLPTSEQRKQALTGVRDIDLADPRTYNELFKGVSPGSWRDLWLISSVRPAESHPSLV